VKRIQELESGLKEFETKITAKDSELAMIKQEIYHSRVNKKDDERQAKLIDALQETNRTLTSQVLDLQEKLRQEQRKTALAEQIKNSSSNEIKRLSDEITLLREQANRLTEKVNKAREDRDRKVREKTKEI
jgi:septal ring factor EnvC (AmiA/AmiB activator)